MRTEQYAPGRSVDLFGEPSARRVLLWHGTQTDARASVGVLAELLAERGLGVVAPDWDSHSDDGGRADLLASVEFARSWGEAAGALAVVGWSLGGLAAAGLTAHASRHGYPLAHTVCLAGAFVVRDPVSGADDVVDELRTVDVPTPFTLLHGTADDVVPPEVSRQFAGRLHTADWPVRLIEMDADHGNIAGARYDAAADRYGPASDPVTRRVAAEVADHIAAALAD
ncbi:dipeptidyl aminopeptidase/acylaminoacyl peptidase [Mycolicibacterium iranicum]|uniref:Dipeptidyl aminopeptidase/acylaminoacyl peptidase n=1 Tax=Mycolicibacterium iranicum TaxID=912594 RepID=A0A839Q188_MYCIR|nr:esterase [Mycolicibacterium iranicum]MBB2989193.1 dipeptidyl aminopeptidase/acylaminoacyl peptidase [Mycolicibacterium iranicum]